MGNTAQILSNSSQIYYYLIHSDLYHFAVLTSCFQVVAAIADIPKDIPIHLELASMTDKDFMNNIMQEVQMENRSDDEFFHREKMNVLKFQRSLMSSVYLIKVFASC